jgi:hypothetical protein
MKRYRAIFQASAIQKLGIKRLGQLATLPYSAELHSDLSLLHNGTEMHRYCVTVTDLINGRILSGF